MELPSEEPAAVPAPIPATVLLPDAPRTAFVPILYCAAETAPVADTFPDAVTSPEVVRVLLTRSPAEILLRETMLFAVTSPAVLTFPVTLSFAPANGIPPTPILPLPSCLIAESPTVDAPVYMGIVNGVPVPLMGELVCATQVAAIAIPSK